MKTKLIIACCLSLILSTNAFALNPNLVQPDVDLNFSGDTVLNGQIEFFVENLCALPSLDYFISENELAEAWYCVMPAINTGLPVDLNVLIRKNNNGSPFAMTTVSTVSGEAALDFAACNDNGVPPDIILGDRDWGCLNQFINIIPHVAITSSEIELYSLAINRNPLIADPQIWSLFPVTLADTFGIVVSEGLRNALQSAQGLPIGSDQTQDMPSLPSQVVENIFSGSVDNWDDLGIPVPANSDNRVNVCLFDRGLGAQPAFNALFHENACAFRGAAGLGFLGFSPANDTDGIINSNINGTGNINVPQNFLGFDLTPPYFYANHIQSDMGSCMTDISNDQVQVNGFGPILDRWAIGIQRLDAVDEGRIDRNEFKFIAMDGVTPILEQVATGNYPYWQGPQVFWRNDILFGDQLFLAQRFIDFAQSIATIVPYNESLVDDAIDDLTDDRPFAGFRFPEIINAGGFPERVGQLAFARIFDNVFGFEHRSNIPFDILDPVLPYNRRLVAPSSCAVPILSDQVDTSVAP